MEIRRTRGIDEEAEMLKVGRNLILLLVALLALAALVTTAFAPGEFAAGDDEVERRSDDSSDVYGVSDDDDVGPGNPPTNDTGSDFNTSGKWSNRTLSDHSTAWGL